MSKIDALIKAKNRLDFLKLNLNKLNSFEETMKIQNSSYGDRKGFCLNYKYFSNIQYWINPDNGKLERSNRTKDEDICVELQIDRLEIAGLKDKIISTIKYEIIAEIEQLKKDLKDYL